MFNKAVNTAVVALAAARLVSAQTFTDCDPLEKTCPPDQAFGKNGINCDWTSACKGIDELPGTTITYDNKGALFSIEKESNAPTVASHKRIFFGSLEVELQAAIGKGIVTSVVLESADLDEIDWEWVGGDNAQVQSNYYGKGDTTTYDRVGFHPVDAPLDSFHTYKIEWTSKAINWIIDGAVVRTVTYDEAKGGSRFPQTPMEVKVGTWVGGGKDSPEGTVEWAGGYADFSQAPFNAWYKSIKIVDYAGKDTPTKDDIKEYVWTDKTGSWESIKVVKGDGSEDEPEEDKTTSKPKPKPTKSDEEDKPTKTKTKTTEPTTEEDSTKTKTETKTKTSGTPTGTPTGSNTVTTPGATTPGSTPSSSPPAPGTSGIPEDAATGLLASFGRVAAAGAAAVLVAQLF